MRKSKLIEMLNKIEGNPEIKLWNGLVGDWMDFQLTEGDLVKETFNNYAETVRLEEACDLKNWDHKLSEETIADLKKIYKKFKWEHNKYVYKDDIEAKRYRAKRVIFIDAKLRDKTHYDRLGSINY